MINQLKTAKGTKDYNPYEMAIREKIFSIIKECFKCHGAVTIDTPIFELREILTGKYGEESKLIYNLEDQGGELCSLRYDLTVPFARYLSQNKIKSLKRYQIGKVYRRDQPAMNRGRFREFYQCDFDIAGNYGPMIPDAETLKLITEILSNLGMKNYQIRLNHRKLLDGMLGICGVLEDKFKTVCSSIDKLDKLSWHEVKKEIIEKGLEETVVDKIKCFVDLKGKPVELLKKIKDSELNEFMISAIKDLELLFEYLNYYGILNSISFDCSLARGLDYYTGIIFEIALLDMPDIGSVGGGGRYDNLVGTLGGNQVPIVGFSIGIERIFSIFEKYNTNQIRENETQVFVASPDGNLEERMKICAELWNARIRAEMVSKSNPKIKSQMAIVEKKGIPYAIIIGDDEIKNGIVQIKNMKMRHLISDMDREKIKEVDKFAQTNIPRNQMIEFLINELRN